MYDNREEEARRMKQEISLVDFLSTRGYDLLEARSTPTTKVMIQGDHKITISKGRDGNWCWISREGAGSVFDYLQICEPAQHPNLGTCRQTLRPYLAGSVTIPAAARRASATVKPSEYDPVAIRTAYNAFQPITDGVHPYLNNYRGLPPSLLSRPFLRGKIRQDNTRGHGNAIFPHFNKGGLSGYISLNEQRKAFSSGGAKGLFGTTPAQGDTRLVIAEGVCDGLAYLHAHGPDNVRLVSFEGTMNRDQPDLIRSAIEKLPRGEVIAAVDNDAGGDKFEEELRGIFQEAKRGDLVYRRDSPRQRGFDWCDAIKSGPALSRSR